MAYSPFFPWFQRSVGQFLRRRDDRRQRRFSPRLQVESLETRIVPSTYTLPVVNQTGLDLSQYSIYVAGWSTGGNIGTTNYPPMELTLPNGSSTAQFSTYTASSGNIPVYNVNNLSSISLDSTVPVAGARVYFFVEPKGDQPPQIPFANSGLNVTQPPNPPSNFPPFDIVEITQPPDSVNSGLPTVDVQTVDGFIFPLTLSLNNNLGAVGQPLDTNLMVNRASILAAYTSFMNNQAGGAAYQDLLFAPNSIAGQADGILNPGRYLASGANSGSALNNVWNSALTTLFQTGPALQMIGDDGAYYVGTPTQVGSAWVLHFVGYTDVSGNLGPANGNVFNIYSPLTPDPLGSYQTSESAGEMVFANDGVFADTSSNVVLSGPAGVAAGLERDIVQALNRGVANLGTTRTAGSSSIYWGTQTNWYPAGQTENLFSLFMHTATVNGTPIFALPSGAVNDAQGAKMGAAYGFAYDENPGHIGQGVPANQPNVPSKFDPVPAGTSTITLTLGPWFPPQPASPPPSSTGSGATSSGPLSPSLLQLIEVWAEALCVADGAASGNGFLVDFGVQGFREEIAGLPADLQSQLSSYFIQNVVIDFAMLNTNPNGSS